MNMKNFIFQIDSYMREQKRNVIPNQFGQLEGPKIRTFVSSQLEKVQRVELEFKLYSYDDGACLLFIHPLEDFSKNARRFFALMTTLMLQQVGNLPHAKMFATYASKMKNQDKKKKEDSFAE